MFYPDPHYTFPEKLCEWASAAFLVGLLICCIIKSISGETGSFTALFVILAIVSYGIFTYASIHPKKFRRRGFHFFNSDDDELDGPDLLFRILRYVYIALKTAICSCILLSIIG
ncbi:MAG: hypothetical protein ACI4XA_01460 [Oscillospiraceae bacterium]